MRKLFTLFLLSFVGLLGSPAAWADHLSPNILLSAHLTGAQEAPAVNTAAQGTASFVLNATRDTLFINATFTGLSGAITGAGIYNGQFGASGTLVTDLATMIRGNQLRGYLTATELNATKLRAYLAGQYYINIRTAANTNGEIRGQINIESDYQFIAYPEGDQEVPAVTADGIGVGIFTLSRSTSKLKFQVTVTDLSGAITGAGFYTGAFGQTGTVAVDLSSYISGNTISGEITPTADFLSALATGNLFINLRTAANPDGEVRGQLYTELGRYLNLDARLDGSQVVPATTTSAKATAIMSLTPTLDTLFIDAVASGLSGNAITGAYFAVAATGQPYTSMTVGYNLTSRTSGNVLSASLLVAPENVSALLRGDFNLMFTTSTNPTGEIRGQAYRVFREGYTFSLNGQQERPTPTPSAGYGSGFVSIDRDQSNAYYDLTWGGLTGPAQAGHFHTGLSSQAGSVVYTIFNSPVAVSSIRGYWNAANNPAPNDGSPFTLRRSIQFQKDSMYVNLHTAQYPNGEIRGQVYRGARNLQRILPTQPAALVTETFTTYPSPFQNALTLNFDARRAGTGRVQVADMLGRIVTTQTIQVRSGANAQQLALPNAAAGVYLVTVEVDGAKLVSRVLKE